MKHTILLVGCLVLCAGLYSQSNIFPDSFPNVKGYKSVAVRIDYICSSPVLKNQLSSRYYFDNNGNTREAEQICDDKVCGRQRYTYVNNQLARHQNYSTWTSPENNPDDSNWDSTALSNEISFTWNGNRLASFRDHSDFMGGDFMEKKFIYDDAGRMASEEIRTPYDSLKNDQFVRYFLVDRKEYSYRDTTVTVNYYRNKTLVAKESIVKNKKGLVLKSEVKKVPDGRVIERISYKYNPGQQPIEINLFETGYDGFGNTYDSVAGDKTTMEYDAAGKLVTRRSFNKGRLCSVEHYIYTK